MIYIATDNYKDGFPLSKAYDDTIYQKGNGEYYLKFRFPVDRLGVWKHLTCETILKADDTRGLQLFKIKKINKINGYIRVYCKHISDDLNYIGVDKLSVTNATGRRVMEALAGSTTEQHNFIFNSDVATMHTLNLSNTTAGKILSKDKHSIIGQWGGELVRDNFLVDLKARAGVDTEILFMNKKNVKNLDNAISTENLTTRLKLSVEKEHEGKKQTITATVDSPNINAYPRIYTNYLKVTNNNITTQEELIEYGKKYFRDKLVDFPTDNLTVNVIDKNQEQVKLFDTVWFRNVDFNIDKRLKVVAYEYSPMAKRYKKISFGALKVSNLSQIKSLSQLEDKIEEKVNESFVDAFKIQKNLSELLKSDRKGIEDKLVELEEKSKGALEVKKALFEADGTIPDVVKAKILDAVEGDIGRLKTIITEAELIKAIQAKLNFAEIKNALIDKAFINQIISDEKFTQQFEEGQVTTQNIFTKLKDSIKSNISKEFVTKDGVRKLVNDLTIDADGIRQITQQESQKVFNTSINGKVQEIVGEVKKNLPTKEELKGKSSYLHKKYSDFADGRNMSDNSTLKYIGIYTGEKQQAPTNASEYSWTKIRGEDGNDGVSNYIHRKYSDFSNGANMSDNSNLKYIGIYTGTSATPPTTASSYLWSKIKGEDGANGTPGTKGADGRTPYFHTAYSNSATGDRDFSTTNSTGKQYIGTYSDFEVADSTDYRKYKWVKIKGENGERGRDGVDGKDGDIGLNLLKGTKEFNTSYFAPPDAFQRSLVWVDETERYEDFAVKSTIYQFNGLWQNVELEKGKTYEFGFFAKGSRDTDRILFSPGWPSSSAKQPLAQYNVGDVPFKLTTTWKFYSFRFTVTETGWSQCRVEKNEYNNGIKLSICGLYLKEVKNNQQTPLKWSPSIEDLQGHSLTANLRFEGRYINSITTNVKPYLDVYYDGQKVDSGFNAQVKYKGGNSYEWSGFWTAEVDSNGGITNVDWGNREQNGTPLEVIVLVTYKGLNTIASERMENVPDVTEIKETVRKYRTFESTLDRFNSTIGQVKEQVVNGNRNYITNSGSLSDKEFNSWGHWEKHIQNGTVVLTKIGGSNTTGFNLNLADFLRTQFQNETLTWSIDVRASRNFRFNHIGFETNGQSAFNITTEWQRISHTFVNRFENYYRFTFYNPNITFNNGDKIYIRFPKLEKGNVATEWTVAPEDVNLLKETTETSIEQTNRNLELKVSKDNVIASINASVETTGEGPAQGVVKINADKVDIRGALRAYKGYIGGFQIGTHEKDPSKYWLTGTNQFYVGMSNGGGNWGQTALWVNWGTEWGSPGNQAWFVKEDGRMFCYNKAEFWSTPVIHGDLKVTGNIIYDNGKWCFSRIYNEIGKAGNRLFLRGNNGAYDYINIDSLVSDRRLKSNIKKSTVNALEVLNKFETYSFTRKYREDVKDIELGIMAQDIKEYMPDAFVEHPAGYYTYEPFEIIPYLIKAIQELTEENTNLKAQLNEMNERLTKLEDKINGNL